MSVVDDLRAARISLVAGASGSAARVLGRVGDRMANGGHPLAGEVQALARAVDPSVTHVLASSAELEAQRERYRAVLCRADRYLAAR